MPGMSYMRVRPLVIRLPLVFPLVLAVGHAACQGDRNRLDDTGLQRYEQRNLADSHRAAEQEPDGLAAQRPRPGDGGDRPMVRLTGLVTNQDSGDVYQTPTLDINSELPDPIAAPAVFQERFEKLTKKLRRDYRRTRDGKITGIYPNAERNIGEIARPRRIELSLADVIRRTLANNYQIRIEGYGPAISAAQIVQAEAVFDAAFFALINRDDRDTPTAVELAAGQSLVWSYTGGLRQRLITGADATLSYVMVRTDVPGFQFQTLNPSYTSDFVFELRQPLLRNFGVDFNRSQIMIAKNSRESSLEAFRRRVIESLQQVERFYWTLVAARRQVVITGELLAQAERTLEQVT
ncbi:MAG: TolC family protein, partial [Phycisphaerae bacterium]